MAIEDLRIEPVPGASNLTEGLLGLTDIRIAGVVKFQSNKAKPIKSLKLLLIGAAETALRLNAGDHTLFSDKRVFLTKTADSLAGVVSESDGSLAVKVGENECTFEFALSKEECADFPGTVEYVLGDNSGEGASKGDLVSVQYSIAVQIETMGGFLSSPKKLQFSEIIDLPQYNIPNLVRSQQTDTTVFISGVEPPLEHRVTVSRGIFSLGQNIHFVVHGVHSLDRAVVVKSLICRIRQDTTITAKERSKKISTYVATAAGKFYQEAAAKSNEEMGGRVVWKGEGAGKIDFTHKKQSKGMLSGTAVIDALGSVNVMDGFFEIHHFAELCVGLKDGRELKFTTPVVFEAVDVETKEWLILNAAKLARGPEE
ncbi:hypothetical protein BC830DRAFT_1123832 [Chytriomyces sp. MP71]|nr:hypothetical protein BC830DRAFT_1123832 [Chytriomyces sp. MP71]